MRVDGRGETGSNWINRIASLLPTSSRLKSSSFILATTTFYCSPSTSFNPPRARLSRVLLPINPSTLGPRFCAQLNARPNCSPTSTLAALCHIASAPPPAGGYRPGETSPALSLQLSSSSSSPLTLPRPVQGLLSSVAISAVSCY
jgi:hypothetical protein